MKRIKGQLDIVINTAYVHDITNYVKAVRPEGIFIQPALSEVDKPTVFDMMDLVLGQKVFAGTVSGSRREMQEMLDFSAKHGIEPKTETYEWKEFPTAYKKLAEVKMRYRGVIDVANTFDY